MKRQAEGLREWEKVDNDVGARRHKFLESYTLEGSLSEKIEKVKHLLNSLGITRIEARTLVREGHNEGVRETIREEREFHTNNSRKNRKKKRS